MRYRLDLVLKPVEGALVRVIGMTERRGFAPCAISGGSEDGDGRWRLQLVVDGSRPASTTCARLGEPIHIRRSASSESDGPTALDLPTLSAHGRSSASVMHQTDDDSPSPACQRS